MSSTDAIPRSPLDKPLHLLTEDDISQLTREDCRRYLKEKGMRRPSWNKSQAIQQVISLKALLEPAPDSDSSKKPRIEHVNRVDVPSAAVEKRSVTGDEVAAAGPVRQEYTTRHHANGRVLGPDFAAGSPRVSRDNSFPVKQLTVFYGGKVNVYDDVPRDKAQTLLQMAASPLSCLQDTPYEGTPVLQPHASLQQCLTTKVIPNYVTANLQSSHTAKVLDNCQLQREENSINREDNQVEGAASRKASLQRYLEKRKDRFKRKVGMPSSLDTYLNPRMVDNVHDEQSGPSDIYSSSPQSSLPHFPSRCIPVGNTIADLNLSANNTDADEL